MARTDVREIVVPAVLKEIDRVRRFLKDYVAGLGLDEEDSLKVELALHEICVNVAMYAYPEEPHGEMAVRLWREDGVLVIEVRDKGVPFNPVKKKNPDLLVKLRRGLPGGLGVYFYRTLMDGLSYRRARGENVLTVRKSL
ncbi:MAG: anti-sigma regulatory factor [Candidatus Aminicenantes bacterium]|jgi:anti-sigma regulatory factor (Ser/Thr protein kinase)|nr:anti-sigma regulatory factor [Candidatus Aminicenantes bacterium]